MQYDLACVWESVAGLGEDCHALSADAGGALLCVADGCGGLGAERYEALGGHTGAYLASRLAVECICEQALSGHFSLFPGDRTACGALCRALESALACKLAGFERRYLAHAPRRVVGSMRRTLPTTLCMTLLDASSAGFLDGVCLWAGDSRAYLLARDGLRLMTADHTRATNFASPLHADAPLSNLLCADKPGVLSLRRFRLGLPCTAILATDGAYGAFSTPMGFERALLETLASADGMPTWREGLLRRIRLGATDDATLLLAAYGYADFTALRSDLTRGALAHNDDDWTRYRARYDHTEDESAYDWRL